jgi:ferric-dicitrate binding protein FerR (iron transport regulator)
VRFTGRKRRVFLEGEGYFKVKPDHTRPFIVRTENTRVVALGTSFNVQAYQNNVNEEVTLVEGRVVVEKKQAEGSFRHLLVMQPGQHVKLNRKTGKVLAIDQETEKYIAWKDGRLVFRNDPLSRIVKEMERFYNVEIEVKDSSLYKYHFHATFEDETLFEALRLLTISTPMGYKICKRKKNEEGVYEKRKVIIYKK